MLLLYERDTGNLVLEFFLIIFYFFYITPTLHLL